jgi:hypothetical protein
MTIKQWRTDTTMDYVEHIQQYEAFDALTRAELKLQNHLTYQEYVHAKLMLERINLLEKEMNTHNNIGDTHDTQ